MSQGAGGIVDIGNSDGWPKAVNDLVAKVVESLTDDSWLEYPFDYIQLIKFEQEEQQLRRLLSRLRLVAYHAARLLPHEFDDVLEQGGLRILTEELRREKVASALERYPGAAESDTGGRALLADGPNAWQGTTDRLGMIHFVAPIEIFEYKAHSFINFLNTWGGETLGWIRKGSESTELLRYLTARSQPAIIEFAPRVAAFSTSRMLLPAFAGAFASASAYWNQWRTNESVPSEFVLSVITPEDPRWPEPQQGIK